MIIWPVEGSISSRILSLYIIAIDSYTVWSVEGSRSSLEFIIELDIFRHLRSIFERIVWNNCIYLTLFLPTGHTITHITSGLHVSMLSLIQNVLIIFGTFFCINVPRLHLHALKISSFYGSIYPFGTELLYGRRIWGRPFLVWLFSPSYTGSNTSRPDLTCTCADWHPGRWQTCSLTLINEKLHRWIWL